MSKLYKPIKLTCTCMYFLYQWISSSQSTDFCLQLEARYVYMWSVGLNRAVYMCSVYVHVCVCVYMCNQYFECFCTCYMYFQSLLTNSSHICFDHKCFVTSHVRTHTRTHTYTLVLSRCHLLLAEVYSRLGLPVMGLPHALEGVAFCQDHYLGDIAYETKLILAHIQVSAQPV